MNIFQISFTKGKYNLQWSENIYEEAIYCGEHVQINYNFIEQNNIFVRRPSHLCKESWYWQI